MNTTDPKIRGARTIVLIYTGQRTQPADLDAQPEKVQARFDRGGYWTLIEGGRMLPQLQTDELSWAVSQMLHNHAGSLEASAKPSPPWNSMRTPYELEQDGFRNGQSFAERNQVPLVDTDVVDAEFDPDVAHVGPEKVRELLNFREAVRNRVGAHPFQTEPEIMTKLIELLVPKATADAPAHAAAPAVVGVDHASGPDKTVTAVYIDPVKLYQQVADMGTQITRNGVPYVARTDVLRLIQPFLPNPLPNPVKVDLQDLATGPAFDRKEPLTPYPQTIEVDQTRKTQRVDSAEARRIRELETALWLATRKEGEQLNGGRFRLDLGDDWKRLSLHIGRVTIVTYDYDNAAEVIAHEKETPASAE